MQKKKKKIYQKFEREKERESERQPFFVRKNYTQNKRDNDKFIVRGCE